MRWLDGGCWGLGVGIFNVKPPPVVCCLRPCCCGGTKFSGHGFSLGIPVAVYCCRCGFVYRIGVEVEDPVAKVVFEKEVSK